MKEYHLQGKLEITWPNGMGQGDREMWNRRFRDFIFKLDKESRLEELIQFVENGDAGKCTRIVPSAMEILRIPSLY
jgi:hypothetical protein